MSVQIAKEAFTFKMDPNTKESFAKLCDEIGVPMFSAINALCKQAVRKQSLSFNLLDENGFTPEDAKEIKKSIQRLESGEGEEHKVILK